MLWDALSNVYCEVESLVANVKKVEKLAQGGNWVDKVEVKNMLSKKGSEILDTICKVLITYQDSSKDLTSKAAALKKELEL